MNLGSSSSVFVAVAAIVVVAALASAFSVFPAGSGTATSGQTSASTISADGLRLNLQISASSIDRGGSVAINVTETNINSKPLNVSAARGWAIQGLRMSACYASVYPFGVAVFEGHYSGGNISSATPLNLYPLEPCPLLIRYISGYYFQQGSDLAVVLPGSGAAIPMSAGVVAAGNYTSGNDRIGFAPGVYTVAAGDEWGSAVLLYFTVG